MLYNLLSLAYKLSSGFVKTKAILLTFFLLLVFKSTTISTLARHGRNLESHPCLVNKQYSYNVAQCSKISFIKSNWMSDVSLITRDIAGYGPAVYLLIKGNLPLYNQYAAALVGVAVISESAKLFIHKMRPDGTNYKSFPSGHMVLIGCGLTIMWWLWGRKTLFITVPITILMGVNRICACRHDHIDVLSGFLLGALGSYIIMNIIGKMGAFLRKYSAWLPKNGCNVDTKDATLLNGNLASEVFTLLQDRELNNVAVIAGGGEMPVIVCQKLESIAKPYLVVKINNMIGDYGLLDNFLAKSIYAKVAETSFFRTSKTLKILKNNSIKKVIMIGSVKKVNINLISRTKLFKFIPFIKFNFFPDIQTIKVFLRIKKTKIRGDDGIVKNIVGYLEECGFSVIGAHQIVPEMIASTENIDRTIGNMRSCNVCQKDIELGRSFLSAISSYDVGQAVIVQNSKIIGMEGTEGTNNLIDKYASYYHDYGNGPVLVKCSKSNQELRSDMPCIGEETIHKIAQYNFAGIAIEKDKVLIINIDKVKNLVEKYNIFLTILD